MEPAQAKKFVTVNNDEKGAGDLKTPLTSDMGMDSLEFARLLLGLALVLYFLTLLLFLCLAMLIYIFCATVCWEYVTCFFILVLQEITVKRLP